MSNNTTPNSDEYQSKTSEYIEDLLKNTTNEFCHSLEKNHKFLKINKIGVLKLIIPSDDDIIPPTSQVQNTIDLNSDVTTVPTTDVTKPPSITTDASLNNNIKLEFAPLETGLEAFMSFLSEPKLTFLKPVKFDGKNYLRSNYIFENKNEAEDYAKKIRDDTSNNKTIAASLVCNKEELNYDVIRSVSTSEEHLHKILDTRDIDFDYGTMTVTNNDSPKVLLLKRQFKGKILFIPIFKLSGMQRRLMNKNKNGEYPDINQMPVRFRNFCSQLNSDVPLWKCGDNTVTATVTETFTGTQNDTPSYVKGSLAGNLMRSINDDVSHFKSQYSDFAENQHKHIHLAKELEHDYQKRYKEKQDDLVTDVRKTYFEEYNMKRSKQIKQILFLVMLAIGVPTVIYLLISKTPINIIIPTAITKTLVLISFIVLVYLVLASLYDYSKRSKFNFDDYDLRTYSETDKSGMTRVGLKVKDDQNSYINLRLYTKKGEKDIEEMLKILEKHTTNKENKKLLRDKETNKVEISKEQLSVLMMDPSVSVEYDDTEDKIKKLL